MAKKSYVLKDGQDVVCKIDTASKRGAYFLKDSCSQYKRIETIALDGFDKLPAGLWRRGFGFTGGGGYLVDALASKYGRQLGVRLLAAGKTGIRSTGKSRIVSINGDDLRALNVTAQLFRQERNAKTRGAVARFLHEKLPAEFPTMPGAAVTYAPGAVASILGDPKVVGVLSKADKDALAAIYPAVLTSMNLSAKSAANVKFAIDSIGSVRTVLLKKVVAEYERKLTQKSLSESEWQSFLHTNVLLLLHSYAEVVEKQSVDLDGKFPDFMLIDPYGYLDIYEIKKPQTNLVRFDDSRGNYYWDTELSKAIAQAERYIDGTREHRLTLIEKIEQKTGRKVKIVRPRGFVVAGMRSQLTGSAAESGFRILNDSLKNVDVLLYDDILANVKALMERFAPKKKAKK